MTTQDQLQQFHQFAIGRLDNGGSAMTLDELYDEWRLKNPDPDELVQDCKAVAASLRDFDAGERGTDADEFKTNFRSQNGIE